MMNNCYVGVNSNNRECHKLSYSRKKGFKNVHDYDTEQLEILFLRADLQAPIDFSSIDNLVCYHHDILLMNKFETKQSYCCDPFSVHGLAKVSGRKAISLQLAKQLSVSSMKNIKPGYKLCPRCQSQINKPIVSAVPVHSNYNESEMSLSASDATDGESMEQVEQTIMSEKAKDDTNTSLAAIGE